MPTAGDRARRRRVDVSAGPALAQEVRPGKGDVPGRPDNKLSSTEFAIAPEAFAGADANGDDALDMDELRKLLARPPIDLTLDVTLCARAAGQATVRGKPRGDSAQAEHRSGSSPTATSSLPLDRFGSTSRSRMETPPPIYARRLVQQQFKAADANKDGYLEGKELAAINGPAVAVGRSL